MQLFCDMDGVLADFDRHHLTHFGRYPDKQKDDVDWNVVRMVDNFYLHIPPMQDAFELWDYIASFKPIVLTGIPSRVEEAASNKQAWVRKHLGDHVEVRCCRSKEKCLHAKPGDILIDDWEKYRKLWINQGGVWITHTSAKSTINELRKLVG